MKFLFVHSDKHYKMASFVIRSIFQLNGDEAFDERFSSTVASTTSARVVVSLLIPSSE